MVRILKAESDGPDNANFITPVILVSGASSSSWTSNQEKSRKPVKQRQLPRLLMNSRINQINI